MHRVAYNSPSNNIVRSPSGEILSCKKGQMVVFAQLNRAEVANLLNQVIDGCHCVIFNTDGRDTIELADTILTNVSLMGSI